MLIHYISKALFPLQIDFPGITDGDRRRVCMDRRQRAVHNFFVLAEKIADFPATGSEHQPVVSGGAAPSTGFQIDLLHADEDAL